MYLIPKDLELDTRKEKRTPIIGTILYTHPLISRDYKYFEGITANLSMNGACIYIYQKLQEDIQIEIHGKALGTSQRNALVKWCKRVDEGIYCAGICFLINP